MKKLLILMLVLGLASTANALTLKISVGGVVDPPDTQITCCPSDTLELDIWSAGYAGIQDGAYWALVVDCTEGTITNGQVKIPPAPSMSTWNGPSAVGAGWVFPPCTDGPWGGIAGAQGETAPAGVYFDGFVFHCEAMGDATVYLYTSPDGSQPYTLQDTQIIHQIPEPVSMLLLGLGGLLLRRRK
jgi:hypothetical protein